MSEKITESRTGYSIISHGGIGNEYGAPDQHGVDID
jgi:hypothetical protein